MPAKKSEGQVMRYATPQKLENAANCRPDTYGMPFLSLILGSLCDI